MVGLLQQILLETFSPKRRPELIDRFNKSVFKTEYACDRTITLMRTWDLRGSGYFMSELLATDLLRASAYHLAGIKIRPKTGKEELSGILIKRREMRRILNHPILLSSLRESFVHKVSFSGIVLEKLLPVDQIRLFEKTDIVIGTHGAGLVNSIFLLPQSHVLEIFPPFWYFGCYRKLCENVEVSYQSITAKGKKGPECDKEPGSQLCQIQGIRNRNFTVDINEVIKRLIKIPETVWMNKYGVVILGVC